MVTMGRLSYGKPWGGFGIFGTGGTGAVSTSANILRYVGAAGAAAVGTYMLLGKGQQQTAQIDQEGKAATENIWNITPGKGGIVNLTEPGAAKVDQTAKIDQTQTSLDMTGLLIIGILGIGALMLFGRKK